MTARRTRMGLALLLASAATFLGMSALESDPVVAGPPVALCSASDSNSPTGRQYATVAPAGQPVGACIRTLIGGVAPPNVPNCWDAAAAAGFGCTQIVG